MSGAPMVLAGGQVRMNWPRRLKGAAERRQARLPGDSPIILHLGFNARPIADQLARQGLELVSPAFGGGYWDARIFDVTMLRQAGLLTHAEASRLRQRLMRKIVQDCRRAVP